MIAEVLMRNNTLTSLNLTCEKRNVWERGRKTRKDKALLEQVIPLTIQEVKR